MNKIEYIEGDIHKVIKTLEDNSIDFIYTDPPFGTTKAPWDHPLNWEELFKEMWRVLKPNGIICLYSSIPFTYELLKYETPKYNYNWKKNNKTGFFQAKNQPLRQMEEIFIYYKKKGTYNPQMIGSEYHPKRNVKVGGRNGYYGDKLKDKENTYDQANGHKDYFIKTYTNENDNILDMTCHNKYVGDRCKELKRNYLGIDLNLVII